MYVCKQYIYVCSVYKLLSVVCGFRRRHNFFNFNSLAEGYEFQISKGKIKVMGFKISDHVETGFKIIVLLLNYYF